MANTDRWTDMTNPVLVFRNFAKSPKNVFFIHNYIYFIQNFDIPINWIAMRTSVLNCVRAAAVDTAHAVD